MTSDRANSALLIVAHGSTVNPDSSAPTLAHAAEIRRRKIFADVGCAPTYATLRRARQGRRQVQLQMRPRPFVRSGPIALQLPRLQQIANTIDGMQVNMVGSATH